MRYLVLALTVIISACDMPASREPVSASGVKQAAVAVQTQSNGMTVEQNQIAERYRRDNVPGSIKHLYVISAYSGQVLIYSTVRGKVTSSGKRLTPTSVHVGDGANAKRFYGFPVSIGGTERETDEVLQDDGTYGSSIPYLFWFDTKGVYHQHYPEGGQIIHISDQPLSVPRIILNMETSVVSPPDSSR